MEEKCGQAPVLETPPLLGQSLLHEQFIPTTGPVRINAALPGGGQPGWEHSNKHGYLVCHHRKLEENKEAVTEE